MFHLLDEDRPVVALPDIGSNSLKQSPIKVLPELENHSYFSRWFHEPNELLPRSMVKDRKSQLRK
jgi:hypothetical protein